MADAAASAEEPRREPARQQSPMVRLLAALLCIALPLGVAFMPLGIEPRAQTALAITAFIIMCCVTQFIDYAVAGLIGCLLYWMTGIVGPQVAFGGFASDTTWFILAAILFGMIAARSGLPTRVANFIVTRVGLSYPRILLGLIVTDFLLTFLVPTGIGRVVILTSVAAGLVRVFDVPRTSNIARGMFLIITYTAVLFDKMIIAGATAITARGIIVEHANIAVSWGQWFIAFLPCVLATIFVAWALILWLYPPEVKSLKGQEARLRAQFRTDQKWDMTGVKSVALILGAILLWMTDFLHGIEPGMVAFTIAMIALLPYIGVLDVEDIKRTNMLPVLFVGAALSMGIVLRETGALSLLTSMLVKGVQPLLLNEAWAVSVLYWGAFIYHLFIPSEVSMIATSLPTIIELAHTHGFNPLWIGLLWTFAAGGKIFVYQSGVLVVGYSYGYFNHIDMIKIGASLTLAEFVGVILTEMFWWPVIGITP